MSISLRQLTPATDRSEDWESVGQFALRKRVAAKHLRAVCLLLICHHHNPAASIEFVVGHDDMTFGRHFRLDRIPDRFRHEEK
jgi:hypothetical protein